MTNTSDHNSNEKISGLSFEEKKIWEIIEKVPDPEIPVLTVADLGIIRKVAYNPAENIAEVTITPTYSGCPAMDVIAMTIRMALMQKGYKNIKIHSVLSPAWTTEWMSETARQKLKAYGIAPPNPQQSVCHPTAFQAEEAVQCPRCNSYHTKLISQFGSTPCKSFYQCQDCQEPFDYFKCH